MKVLLGIFWLLLVVGFSCRYNFWRLGGRGIPVLMYHKVSENRGKGEKLRVSSDRFERQMHYLYAHGYRTISADELINFCQGKLPLPKRVVVVSFDDGYKDNYLNALPILKRYGFSSVIFPITDYVGEGEWDGEPLLSWEEIEKMRREGMRFGSHSRTHRSLLNLSDDELKAEVKGSKAYLEERLSEPVNFFSYPVGEFNERVKDLVISCGYRGAFSTLPGKNKVGEDIYALRRILIRGYDTWLDFLLKLWKGRSHL